MPKNTRRATASPRSAKWSRSYLLVVHLSADNMAAGELDSRISTVESARRINLITEALT
jgi:hypothetical protein